MKEVQIHLWTPHQNQKKLIQDKSRYKVIVCGRRFGKTTYAVNTLIKQALLQDNAQFFYIAPTYKQAKMIAWRMLETQARSLPKELVSKTNESELYVVLGNNSRIDIKGADNPDSLRGVGLNGVVLDEYADIKPHVYDEIVSPALVDNKGFAIFIGTPKGFNHFYDLYTRAQHQDDWSTFKFTTYDNPHLDPKEIDKERERITQDRFAQEYLADFRKQEGLVYKEFDRAIHVFTDTEKVGKVVEKIAGVDFGYTNPACVLEIWKDFDDNYYVVREWYKSEQTDDQIAEYTASLGVNGVYPDPENPSAIEYMRQKRVNVREVVKGKDSVYNGIQQVRELFKQNKLFVHESCENLIFELERYAYEQEDDEKNPKEIPIKYMDHAVDALRYAIMMNAGRKTIDLVHQKRYLANMRKRNQANYAR